MILNALLSTLLNLVVLAGLPFFGYWLYHRLRHKRRFAEIASRAGLRLGESRYLAYSAVFAAACVAILLAWRPPLASFTGSSSPQQAFVGLVIGATSIGSAEAPTTIMRPRGRSPPTAALIASGAVTVARMVCAPPSFFSSSATSLAVESM